MSSVKSLACRAALLAGLFATAVELMLFGAEDVSSALTFAGRMTGVVFLAAMVLESAALFAAVAVLSGGASRHISTLLGIGILVSLVLNLVLLTVQLADGGYTHHVWIWGLMILWALWALWWEWDVWRGVSRPRGFAAGVVVTAMVAIGNFGYTQVYQPYVSTALLSTTVEILGATHEPGEDKVVVAVRLRTKNTGKVGVFVLGSLYQVSGRKPHFVKKDRTERDLFEDWGDRQRDLLRHTDVPKKGYQLLAQGQFTGRAGLVVVLEPGSEIVAERIVEFPYGAKYDVLGITANVVSLRRDRAKLTDNYGTSGRRLWVANDTHHHYNPPSPPTWIAQPSEITYRFRSRIKHSNSLLEHTRPPHYVTLWWVGREPLGESPFGPELTAIVGPEGTEPPEQTASELRQMTDAYGLSNAPSGYMQKSLADLLRATSKKD
ncbi:hypothetical protein M8Z33_38335 [Streptomyces sp. ZAF1911]|uniref:hypothetical protein n=1 Tax=Streptomyces sp. ZAF1911 TaxID=2944129 RepID=UPI00237A1B36|nr:hypothetical protein [Streptomyces sp. ZAF1911]MDD9382406.1 hypothetical protein [Streptomyces sp. ZAF1911]